MTPKIIENMCWKSLRERKEVVRKLVISDQLNAKINNSLVGVLNVIDDIQHDAIDIYGIDKEEVFGKEEVV